MVTNQSIDTLYPRIQESKTKEYFDEVLSCFYSGNYRSAVVMLYSVAICDLVYKLHRLKDIYNDKTATNILERIEALQDANPKSPDWENVLRDECRRNKRILTPSSATHLENLQKERHLCAHPVLKDSIELFRPKRVAVEAHIVNILAGILTLPPFLEKELLREILSDIDRQRRYLNKGDALKKYLNSRYLDRIKSPEVESRLFLHLWKIVFHLSDDLCNRNRNKNLFFLWLLLNRNHDLIISQIQKESEKLSIQIDIDNMAILDKFIRTMNEYPEIYPFLENSFKISLEAKISSNSLMNNVAFFLNGDFLAFYQQLKSNIAEDDDLSYIMTYTERKLNAEAAHSLPIAVFSRSESFNDATNNFNHLIEPRLENFSIRNLEELLEAIKGNSQIRHSWNVQKHFQRIKNIVEEKKPDFDFSLYSFLH